MKGPDVEFVMKPLHSSPTFRTHDLIDGKILFTPFQEVRMEDISVTFQGITKIEMDNMNTHVPLPVSRLQKTFLCMELPMDGISWDTTWDTTTLCPGRIYQIPFKFIVPEELPLHVCHHQCGNHQIQQEHLRLPASLSYRAHKSSGIHDMSPEMAQVSYSINFTLWQRGEKAARSEKIEEFTHPVQILPMREEHAPILVPSKNKYYQFQSEKNLCKGLFRHAVGKLAAFSTQPPAIHLQALGPENENASTVLNIDLRFEPAHPDELPPTLLTPEFQLRAMTFFGLDPWQDSPDLADISTWGPRQGVWSECVSLTSKEEMQVDWKLPEGSEVLTSSIVTAVALPSHRLYPPTGYSCLVSRTYAIKAKLFYRAHGRTRITSSLSLSLPIEICAK